MSNDAADPPNNSAIITIAQIIKAVMSSAEESELGALFIHFRKSFPERHYLEEMVHK